MTISIIIPAYNEEKTIRNCIDSCLNQTRPVDEILVINDSSSDNTRKVLESFGKKITVVNLRKKRSGKGQVVKESVKRVTSDVFITVDADTVLDKKFVGKIALRMRKHSVSAVSGYVKSLKGNFLTAFREYEYTIGQEVHKNAQDKLGCVYVIPGCAAAFKTKVFKKYISFDHNTLTEDLDYTYTLHRANQKIVLEKEAIAYTQDPVSIKDYINQMRRWSTGGWQNIIKHKDISKKSNVIDLSLNLVESFVYSMFLFALPFINPRGFLYFFTATLLYTFILATYVSYKRARKDLLLYMPLYPLMTYINSYIFLETFVNNVLLGAKNNIWFTPERRLIT